MLVYLVRHLPTEYNVSGVYMGRSCDPPVIQAEIKGFQEGVQRLFPEGIRDRASLLSSPARRCQQTADILKDALGLTEDILVVEEFNETSYGEFEGLHPRQIKKRWPNLYRLWMNAPSQVKFPGGESFTEVQERSFEKLQKLLQEYPEEETLFVITHVDVIKMIISKVLSIPIDCKRNFCIDPGSFSLLESMGEEIRVRYLNLRT